MSQKREDRAEQIGRFRDYLHLLAETRLDPRYHRIVDPSDIVQATLLKALEAVDSLRGRSDREVAAWLRQILSRQIANHLRGLHCAKRDIRRECSLEDTVGQSSTVVKGILADMDSSASHRLELDEIVIQLATAMTHLPPAQREAVILQRWRGWSIDAIAKHMGRSKDAVAGLLRRGLQSLREELKDLK